MDKRFNLYEFRKKKGLTQSEFADKFGFSACYYSLVESGSRKGSFEFWNALQKAYNVPDSEMYGLMKLR